MLDSVLGRNTTLADLSGHIADYRKRDLCAAPGNYTEAPDNYREGCTFARLDRHPAGFCHSCDSFHRPDL